MMLQKQVCNFIVDGSLVTVKHYQISQRSFLRRAIFLFLVIFAKAAIVAFSYHTSNNIFLLVWNYYKEVRLQ